MKRTDWNPDDQVVLTDAGRAALRRHHYLDLIAQLDSAIRFGSPTTPAFLRKIKAALEEAAEAAS